jgi:hypothetical protein
MCPAGKYAAAGASKCTECPKGKYSAAGATTCTACPTGKTTSATGANSETDCIDKPETPGGAGLTNPFGGLNNLGAGAGLGVTLPTISGTNEQVTNNINAFRTSLTDLSTAAPDLSGIVEEVMGPTAVTEEVTEEPPLE